MPSAFSASRWVRSHLAVGPVWWWSAATALTVGALAWLVGARDVLVAGMHLVSAAGCVLAAGLATRRDRAQRYDDPGAD